MLKKILLILMMFFLLSTAYAAENPRWITQPINVYIPKYGDYSKLMYRAFVAWEEKARRLVRFKFVSNPNNANIEVHFVDNVQNCNSDLAVGCERSLVRGNRYYKSHIEIALKQKVDNEEYRPIKNIYGVMLHEIGHALGLGHSDDPNSIMFSYDLPTLQYLTQEDLRLLYKKYH